MDKPRFSGRTISVPSFSVSKISECLTSGLGLVDDIQTLLSDLGVTVSSTKVAPSAYRKDGRKSYKIVVYIASNVRNLLNLFGRIGYAYQAERETMGRYVCEFLTLKLRKMDQTKLAYARAIELRELDGLRYTDVPRTFTVYLEEPKFTYPLQSIWYCVMATVQCSCMYVCLLKNGSFVHVRGF